MTKLDSVSLGRLCRTIGFPEAGRAFAHREMSASQERAWKAFLDHGVYMTMENRPFRAPLVLSKPPIAV